MVLSVGEQILAAATADKSLAAMLRPPAEPDRAELAAAKRELEGRELILRHPALQKMLSAPDLLAEVFKKLEADCKGLAARYQRDVAEGKRTEFRAAAIAEARRIITMFVEAMGQLRKVSASVSEEQFGLPRDENHRFAITSILLTAEMVTPGAFLATCREAVERGDAPLCRLLLPVLRGFLVSKSHYQERHSDVSRVLDLLKQSEETSWTYARSYAAEISDSLRLELAAMVRHVEQHYGVPDPTMASQMCAHFLQLRREVAAAGE